MAGWLNHREASTIYTLNYPKILTRNTLHFSKNKQTQSKTNGIQYWCLESVSCCERTENSPRQCNDHIHATGYLLERGCHDLVGNPQETHHKGVRWVRDKPLTTQRKGQTALSTPEDSSSAKCSPSSRTSVCRVNFFLASLSQNKRELHQ